MEWAAVVPGALQWAGRNPFGLRRPPCPPWSNRALSRDEKPDFHHGGHGEKPASSPLPPRERSTPKAAGEGGLGRRCANRRRPLPALRAAAPAALSRLHTLTWVLTPGGCWPSNTENTERNWVGSWRLQRTAAPAAYASSLSSSVPSMPSVVEKRRLVWQASSVSPRRTQRTRRAATTLLRVRGSAKGCHWRTARSLRRARPIGYHGRMISRRHRPRA